MHDFEAHLEVPYYVTSVQGEADSMPRRPIEVSRDTLRFWSVFPKLQHGAPPSEQKVSVVWGAIQIGQQQSYQNSCLTCLWMPNNQSQQKNLPALIQNFFHNTTHGIHAQTGATNNFATSQ